MSFIRELNERKVIRTAGFYVVGAWLALQAAEVLVGLNVLPESVGRPLFFVLVCGFPIALVLAWFVRWTPGGLQREAADAPAEESAGPLLLIGFAAVVAVGGVFFYISDPETEPGADAEVALAVLPLTTVGPQGTEEYWADGITEQLIGMISRIPGVLVTSRTSAFSFKGSGVSIPEVAQLLSVSYVLTGTVLHDADKIRVRVELIDAARDVQVWSRFYDLAEQSIFAAQDAITAAVGEALKRQFGQRQPAAIVTDPEAYKLYLQGMHAHRKGTEQSLAQGLALCQQSVAIDPLYAPAWECIASCYTNQANRHFIDQSHGVELAESAAKKAIRIDPNATFAHATLGYINNYFHGDIQAAAAAYQEAMRRSGQKVSSGYALLLASVGRFAEAVQIMEAGARRDPLNPLSQGNLAATYFWNRDFARSLDRYKYLLALEPGYFALNYRIAESLLMLGRAQEALQFADQEEHAIYRLIGLALANHSLGNEAAADEIVAELEAEHADIAAYNIAYVKAHQGKVDAAFDYLDKELALSGQGVFSEILGDHFFQNLHADPRWEILLGRVGRAPQQLEALTISAL